MRMGDTGREPMAAAVADELRKLLSTAISTKTDTAITTAVDLLNAHLTWRPNMTAAIEALRDIYVPEHKWSAAKEILGSFGHKTPRSIQRFIEKPHEKEEGGEEQHQELNQENDQSISHTRTSVSEECRREAAKRAGSGQGRKINFGILSDEEYTARRLREDLEWFSSRSSRDHRAAKQHIYALMDGLGLSYADLAEK